MARVNNNIFKLLFFLTAAAFMGYIVYTSMGKKPIMDTPVESNVIAMDYNNDKMSTLDTQLIQNMVDNYTNNQLSVINSTQKMDDAHSISFDLVTLKKFIYHIENETKKAKSSITDAQLGVRLYYAAYPKSTAWDDFKDLGTVDKNYQGLHTLVMIPTIEVNGKNLDFNPLDKTTFESGLPKRDNSTKRALLKSIDEVYGLTGSMNHGSLIPPNDPEAESFITEL